VHLRNQSVRVRVNHKESLKKKETP